MKRKSLAIVMAIVLAFAAILGGSYAWFTSQDSIDNEFSLANTGAHFTEIFDPPTGVVPGGKIDKNVAVVNDAGTAGIFARVRFEEALAALLADPSDPDVAPQVFWNDAPGAGAGEVILEITSAFTDPTGIASLGWEPITFASDPEITVYGKAGTSTDANGDPLFRFVAFVSDTDPAYEDAQKQLVELSDVDFDFSSKTINDATVKYAVNKTEPVELEELTFNADGTVNNGTSISEYINLVFNEGPPSYVEWILANFNTATDLGKWVYAEHNGTGWFYYTKVIVPGDNSADLLERVDFLGTLPSMFNGAKYTLTPYLEAIQADMEAIEAIDAGGWGITAATNANLHAILAAAYAAANP